MTRRRNFGDAIRRDEIMSAAITLIATEGSPRASLARIAEAAGISKAGVLYYFRSKDEVIEAAYGLVLGELTETVGRAMAAAPTGRAEIDAYVRALLTHIIGHPEHIRILIEIAIIHAGTILDPERPQRWAPLAAAIERGHREGDLLKVDARTAAIALGGAIDAILNEALNDPNYDLDAATDQLLDLFHQGVDATPR